MSQACPSGLLITHGPMTEAGRESRQAACVLLQLLPRAGADALGRTAGIGKGLVSQSLVQPRGGLGHGCFCGRLSQLRVTPP